MTVVVGIHDSKTLDQMLKVAIDARYTALMADGHLGYYMPIGGVAAYIGKVSPHGVGVDIACGNLAVLTDLTTTSPTFQYLDEVADEITQAIGFGMGSPTNPTKDLLLQNHDVFDDDAWILLPRKIRNNLKQRARAQLGTVGGGNHYVDIFVDEQERIWIGCHFGSRGLGFILSNGCIALAQDRGWKDLRPNADWNDPVLLSLLSPLGHDYWNLMNLAGDYAYAGREWVVRKVANIMGAEILDSVHNHHNFAWQEQHFEEDLVVVRKGSTPAFPGQRGFVGGSMGDISVILRGEDSLHARDLLRSTVHGAGRVMGRMEAKGKWKRGECVRPGKITQEQMDLATQGVIRRGGDLDEAPQAYRSLQDVLECQGGTITVEHALQPVVVCMAPSRTR